MAETGKCFSSLGGQGVIEAQGFRMGDDEKNFHVGKITRKRLWVKTAAQAEKTF